MSGQWLTTAQVAARWGVSPREVQRAAADGRLQHMRIGRSIRIAESAVAAFERANTRSARSSR